MFADVVARQQRAGWVELDGPRLRLTPAGLLLADRVGGDYLAVGIGQ